MADVLEKKAAVSIFSFIMARM